MPNDEYSAADILEHAVVAGLIDEGETRENLSAFTWRILNRSYVNHLRAEQSALRMHSMLDSLGMAHPQEA